VLRIATFAVQKTRSPPGTAVVRLEHLWHQGPQAAGDDPQRGGADDGDAAEPPSPGPVHALGLGVRHLVAQRRRGQGVQVTPDVEHVRVGRVATQAQVACDLSEAQLSARW
jgi:hypothetical protein